MFTETTPVYHYFSLAEMFYCKTTAKLHRSLVNTQQDHIISFHSQHLQHSEHHNAHAHIALLFVSPFILPNV